MFTSAVKPKTLSISREDLRLPEDAFAVASVGNRLGNEITGELIDTLGRTVEKNKNIYFIFFGSFDTFNERIERLPEKLRSNFIFYGTTKDTMSCLENCNLYLNPPRIGGGMSFIEALSTGLPAVTLVSGDGGIVLGKEFEVKSLDDFAKQIVRYSKDTDYYDIQAKKAFDRGQYLQDSNKVFCDTVKDFIKIIANY